jgi:rod shape-determining protein MreD
LLQATLPAIFSLAKLFALPLLVIIYFSAARQDKVFGIFLGTGLGLLQDALSHSYLGLMGMVGAVDGYLAASAGAKFDVDRSPARVALIGGLVILQNVFAAFLRHALLEIPYAFQTLRWTGSAFLNIALGLVLFRFFDRFQRTA